MSSRKTGVPAGWETKMEIREAQRIVNTLAQGVDPNTGEVFAPDSPYNEPRIIRALFTVHEFVRRARKPRMSPEEKRLENLDLGRPRNFGLPWTDDSRSQVAAGFEDGKTIEELAEDFERTQGAIQAELIRQGLIAPDFR
jgi:hypothetical protein